MDIAVFIVINVLFVLVLLILGRRTKDDPSGTIVVIKDEGKIIYSMELDDDPENLQYKKRITFRVKHELVEGSDAK